MKRHLTIVGALLLTCMASASQAGIIEDLLALPAIQSYMGRQPELQAAIQRCANARYKQQNSNACLLAEQASRMSRVPLEVRTLLANPTTAASLRELCLAAIGSAAQNTYLCAELSKAETSFQTLAQQQRAVNQDNQMQRNQDAQLGR